MIDKMLVWGIGNGGHPWAGRRVGSKEVRIVRLGATVFGGEGRMCLARDPSPLPRWFILDNPEASFMEAQTLYLFNDDGVVQRTLVGELSVLGGDVNTYTVACKRGTWCVERRDVESTRVMMQWETSAQGILWKAIGGANWFVLDCDMTLRRDRKLVVCAPSEACVECDITGLGDSVLLDHVLVSHGPRGVVDHLLIMMTAAHVTGWECRRMPHVTFVIMSSALLARIKA